MTDVFSALTGTGDLLLPAARFVPLVGVDVTTFPPGAAVMDTTTPRRVMKVGWIAPGRLGSDPGWPASLFFEDAKWIDFERELITYPAPGIFCDRIRYHLEPGAVATIYVNEAPPVLPSAFQPWDRDPSTILLQSQQFVTTASATLWSYTVPAGRKFLLGNAEISVAEQAPSSALTRIVVNMWRSTQSILTLNMYANVAAYRDRDVLAAGPLVLLPGETLIAGYDVVQTGGVVSVFAYASGLEFDA